MCEEPLFEYYDIHLHGLVVDNREVADTEDTAEEPELELEG